MSGSRYQLDSAPDDGGEAYVSPTRGGTLDWDDRIVMAAAVLGDAAIAPPFDRGASPARGGTLTWEPLLPPDLQEPCEADDVADAPESAVVRGGTLPWDGLIAAVQHELAAAAQAGPNSEPPSVRVEATQMVFEPPGHDDTATDEMLRWLAPDSKGRK